MLLSKPADTASELPGARRLAALWSPRGWAAFVFGLALLLRCVYALAAPYADPFLARSPLLGDAASYDRIARTLLATGVYGEFAGHPSTFWPPLFPFVLAAIYGAFGYHLWLARLLLAALGAVLPLCTFLAIERLGLPRTARWASLATALYPFLIYFGAWLIAESLYFALMGLVLWLSVRLQQRPSYGGAALLGLAIGLAALAKPTILFQLPFVAIWFVCCLAGAGMSRRLALGAVAALALALALMPWTARNYALLGRPVLISTNGGYTFYGANNADAFGGHYENFPPRIAGLDEAQEQSAYYGLASSWIREHPAQFAWLVGQKFKRLVSPLSVASSPHDFAVPGSALIYLGYSLFLLLSLAGLVLSLKRWRTLFVFYIPLLGVIVSTLLFYGDARYTLPAVPSLLLFACLGAEAAVRRARRGV
ncbi:MAG TPA: glycosyltransferase family 39 protein [Kouleothrix sp.]|uniref:ArnT family glycosyltransferase n=1 Tax=Kouleothrix sp. TaxID=2779161 RepID=UPI002BD116E7|nr:glycosyltransferase family 39 protein [Kouleothrix sp.]